MILAVVGEPSEWINLCEYVKLEILQYPAELKFPKHLALRLRGLQEGKFMANKKAKPHASYECQTILNTFKICKPKIIKYLMENESKIKDEKHRINLVMMFAENEINDVVLRMKKAEKASKKVEAVNLDNQVHSGAEYKSKQPEHKSNLEELW